MTIFCREAWDACVAQCGTTKKFSSTMCVTSSSNSARFFFLTLRGTFVQRSAKERLGSYVIIIYHDDDEMDTPFASMPLAILRLQP